MKGETNSMKRKEDPLCTLNQFLEDMYSEKEKITCRNIGFQWRDGGKGGVKYDTKMLRYPINPLPVSFAGPRASVRDPWRSSCPMSVRRGKA